MGEGYVYTRVCKTLERISLWGARVGVVADRPGQRHLEVAGCRRDPTVRAPLLPGRRQALPACPPSSVRPGRAELPALCTERRLLDCWERGRPNPPATLLGRGGRDVRSQGHGPT